MEPSEVKLYGWDLKGFPKPVLRGIKWMNKVNGGETPKRLIHVGVAVFRRFYHFNQKGFHIELEIPDNKVKLLSESVQTLKTSQEFEEWVNSPEIVEAHRTKKYHPVNNNCIDFAMKACNFLGVPLLPGFHTHLNEWLKGQERIMILFKSPRLLSFFGVSFGAKSTRTLVDNEGQEFEEEEEDLEDLDIDEDELIGWGQV